MLLSRYCYLALLLALDGAVALSTGLSPFLVRGAHPATNGRLYKREVGSAPDSEEEGSHNTVAGHPPIDSIGHPPPVITGHPPTTDLSDGDDIATDYDFVLDLDEQEDFDRLLNMLSRSGPAKPLHEVVAGPSSTFLDRHDELLQPSSPPRPSSASPFLPHGAKYTPQRVDPHAEGSHFDDLENEEKEAEQRRLEQLYFNQVKGKRDSSSEEENGHRHGALRHSAAGVSAPSLAASLGAFLILLCLV